MLFNSAAYLIFLPIVILLFWLVPFRCRTALLTVASYVFYIYWKPIYGLLIFALTVVNYAFGLLLERFPIRKKLILTIAIATNVLVLGYFKYANFAAEVANWLVSIVGIHNPPTSFNIILPLGISFFVFEFIHYLIDVYRGGKPVKGFLDFTLFAAFFPTQIAGPIKRYQDFVPQLHTPQKLDSIVFNQGIELIVFGLFKKIVLADSLAVFVSRCYAHPFMLTGPDYGLATWAFLWQVYFDFSGYTDIARGSAMLLGFRIPINFDFPFVSTSILEFWRRWHISLSSWLRDYVYFALGGNRKGSWSGYCNLAITMAICGLWHGAGPHYVLWGLYCGLIIGLYRVWQTCTQKSALLLAMTKQSWFRYFAVFCTFQSFSFGLVIFRTQSFPVYMDGMGKMLGLIVRPGTNPWMPTVLTTESSVIFALMPLLIASFFATHFAVSRFKELPGIMPKPRWFPFFKPVYLASLVVLLLVLSPDIAPQFVYFQF